MTEPRTVPQTPYCGTPAGYQRHRVKGEAACEDCKAAHSRWMREYRRANPDVAAEERRTNAAQSRAVWRLAREYPEKFRAYVLEELRK